MGTWPGESEHATTVPRDTAVASSAIFGHAADLYAVETLVDTSAPAAVALVLDGEAGIGKTTLWRWGVDRASAHGRMLLRCQPAEAEAMLPFAALGDLLEPLLDANPPSELAALAPGQRLALETALALTSPRQSFDRLAVSRAALTLLRNLAGGAPLLIAIDDVQWLDRATASVLEYAVRRLADAPVRLLLARRIDRETPPPLGLDRALGPERVMSLRVGPLPPGDIDQLVHSRLGLILPHPRLVELHRITGGNPFYALEIARSMRRRGVPTAERLVVPDSLAGLVRTRLTQLSPRGQQAVLLMAATAHPTIELVERVAGGTEGLDEAVRNAVLELDGQRLHFSHPLLASVAYNGALPWQRRAAHQALAGASAEREERALHLALATEEPDAEIAALLDEAADLAARRGAPAAAAGLSDQACRLTPSDHPDDLRRRLAHSAEHHLAGGDTVRGRELLERLIAQSPAGPGRASILLRLGRARYIEDDVATAHQLFQRARAEAGEDRRLIAAAEQALAFTAMFGGDIGRALEHATTSRRLAEQLGDRGLLALALCRVALSKFLAGQGLDVEMMEQATLLEQDIEDVPVEWLPRYARAGMATWTGDFETARGLYAALFQTATERGDERALPTFLFAMSQMESAAGNLETAGRLAAEAVERSRRSGLASLQANALSAQALVSALLGQTEAARTAAAEGLQIAERTGAVAPSTWSLAALGLLELSLGDYAAAHARLGPLAAMVARVGVAEPTIVRFLPDEVEALIGLGEPEQARPLVAMLEQRGLALDRPWAIATGARSSALLAAAAGAFDAAEEALDRAFAALARLPEPLEHGRTLLIAGAIARRARRWRLARERLDQALELFDRLGAALWSKKAAAEIARIPGRRRGGDELTEMEQRVAALVAQGLTNREIAGRLFVSVRTVEANLSKIYAKLGLRSRTELAGRFLPPRNR